MRLIVGLGNPGNEYLNSRHNIGFMFVDRFFSNFILNKKFNAYESVNDINGEKIIVIKPLLYMNLSGEVVLKYVNYYKIKPIDVLVIQDDLDMPVGKVKLLFNHSDGGHNGIKNISLNLNTREFLRLKIGISNSKQMDTKDYVLGKFNNDEKSIINSTFSFLNTFIDDYLLMSMDLLIAKYNRKI